MAGYGSLATGFAEGYLKGQGLKRQDEADANARDDRGLRLQREDEYRQHTLKQRAREDEAYADAKKAADFEKAHTEIGRQMTPFIVSGNPLGAIDVAEKAFNEHPAFSDGFATKILRDANGKPVLDAEGKVTMSVIDQKTNEVKGSGQVDPREYVAWFMSIKNPWAKVQADAAAAGAEATRQKERAEGIADYGTKLRISTDETIRRETKLAEKGLGKGASKLTAFERMAEYWRNADPQNRTQAQAADWARTASQMPYAKQLAELTKLIASTEGGDVGEIRQRAAEMLAKDGITPNNTTPAAAASVDGVASEFGF